MNKCCVVPVDGAVAPSCAAAMTTPLAEPSAVPLTTLRLSPSLSAMSADFPTPGLLLPRRVED